MPPVTQIQNWEQNLPQAFAFGGTVQTYSLQANGENDFLQFMVYRKQNFDEIKEYDVQAQPEKVQLTANMRLEKPALEH